MKASICTLFAILFAIAMSAALAGFMSGCEYHEDSATAELPYACDDGESIAPREGMCLRITGLFRLGGMSRGACHDVWDELTEATIANEMLVSGEYETEEVDCE